MLTSPARPLPADPAADTAVRGVPFAGRLARFGDRVALRSADEELTYAGLAGLAEERAAALGATRRLVLVAGANRPQTLATYLAALSVGHPVLLAPGDNPDALGALERAYSPDVVAGDDGALVERRPGTAHDLHPDLALLLSTSGSTGSPKLVRLSAANVQANAESIAQYLRIGPSDVAATTLPMHYCYGLSVVHSHLLAGASLLLTSRSVADSRFWEEFRAAGATTFAGVPYTFDLLDRVGFEGMHLPSLRYVTQAGGRLAPERVRRFAELGRRRGWDLVVMYGQTEATARMAYLPPERVLSAPGAIGVAVPGGRFRLEPVPELTGEPSAEPHGDTEGAVGELVYEGPNVMLGYASTPADLAVGRVTASLRTGDLARRRPDGLFEVVGRRSRFAKVYGLRVDLDQVERHYAAEDVVAVCAASHGAGGERLVVAVSDAAAPVDPARLRQVAVRHLALPPTAVTVCPVREVPRLPNGKPDYRAVAALGAAEPPAPEPPAGATGRDAALDRLRRAYAEVLGREHVGDRDSFVSLRGDSLSYVEASLRVEDILGHLPAGWHLTPVADLVPAPRTRPGRTVETSVLLRALAIVTIVGSHANLFTILGGAHVLLAVAGLNFARFHLTEAPRRARLRGLARSVGRVVVPSALWIGLVAAVTPGLGWQNALLLNGLLGPRDWAEPAWHYWFVEALVYTLVGVTLLVAVPVVDRCERRWPFGLPMTLAAVALLTRYGVVEPVGGDAIHRAHVVFWLFALGWATVRATGGRQRILVSAVVLATVPGFFGDGWREAFVAAGLLALVWVRSLRAPAWVGRVAGVLASASLYVYLVHWQVYPHLEHRLPWLATALSLLAGIVLWQVAERVTDLVRRARPTGVAATVPAG